MDYGGTGAVVVAARKEQGENDQNGGPDENANIRIRKPRLHDVFRPVKNVAEQNGDKSAEHGQGRDLQQHDKLQRRREHGKVRRTHMKQRGNSEGGQRGQQAGDQRRVI